PVGRVACTGGAFGPGRAGTCARTPLDTPTARRTRRMRARYLRALAFAAALIAVAAIGTAGATGKPAPAPSYKLANVGAYGGEPTIASNSKGELYDTTPSGGALRHKSKNHGPQGTQPPNPDP